MPVKKTIQDVKKEFSSYDYTLLENEYINQLTKMKCVCAKGHYIEITYKSLKKYKGGCKKCGYEKLSKMHSHEFEEVKRMFEDRGYILLENEYRNSQVKMNYKCEKHRDKKLQISLNCLKRGHGCPYCSKKKVDYDQIKKELQFMNYTFLGKEQVEGQSMILYSCPNHPEEVLHIRPTDLRRGYGCKFCAFENRKGDNNHNWKGGISKLSNFLRYSTYLWKKEVSQKTEMVCFITKEKNEEIEIHHLVPFHKIRDEVLNEYGFSGYEEIRDLSQNELDGIRKMVEEKHKEVIGVPLKKSIHKKFHSVYGHDFEDSDFWEFVKDYEKGFLS